MINAADTEPPKPTPVPDVVIMRLPQYIRSLNQLHQAGVEVVSSQQLAHKHSATRQALECRSTGCRTTGTSHIGIPRFDNRRVSHHRRI